MPISRVDLQGLFSYLGGALSRKACDHTGKHTQTYLARRGLDYEKILPWLGEYGGYCDCEVLANVEERWGSE